MKKNMIAGIFAAGLIVAGGTGFYLGNAKPNAQLQPTAMRNAQVTTMMSTGSANSKGLQPLVQKNNQDQNKTFEQMLPFMKKMHPNLSDAQLKSLFERMHGANGTASCGNAQGMMGNTNNITQ